MLFKGDLIRVPANTCIIQIQNELALIEKYQYTKKPEVGIFIKYNGGNEALVWIRNDYFTVHFKDINHLREKKC